MRYQNAYGLQENIPITPEKNNGKQVTKPGMSVNIAAAQKRYSVPSLASELKTYYDKEGLVPLNFERMDRIEQLMRHADLRRDTKEKFELAKMKVAEMNAKEDKENYDNAIKAAEAKGYKAASQTKQENK